MSENAMKALTEERLRAYEELKATAELAASEKRSFSGEEQEKYDRLNAHIDDLDKRTNELVDHAKRGAEAEQAWAEIAARGREVGAPNGGVNEDELRRFFKGEGGKVHTVQPSGTDFRSLVKGTPAAGGDTVPTSFYNRLVEHMTERSAVLQSGVTVMNTAGGENLEIPKTTSHGGPADIIPEGGTITEDDPTFSKVTLGAYKYGRLFYVSPELLNDTGVPLLPYLAKQAGWSLGDALGLHLISGTGTNQPTGILQDTTVGATGPAGAGGGFGSQDTPGEGGDLFIDLFHSVISPYRNSTACGWMMNDNTVAQVRKLKNSQGDYIWQPGLTAGAPDTILGKPVHIDLNVPDVAEGANSVIFGDFSAYFVRLVGGVRFERSEDFAFDTDMVSFRTLMRADAAMVDTSGALKTFAGGGSGN